MDRRPACALAIAASILLPEDQGTAGREICRLVAIPQRNTGDINELGQASVSADGRFVAFASRARLVASDTDVKSDVYVLDLATRPTTLERVFADDETPDGESSHPSLSGDGRFVVFGWSGAEPTATGEPRPQVLVRDRQVGRTRVISVNPDGAPGNDTSDNGVISADGKVVAFESSATNLVTDPDQNGHRRDIYAASIATGVVTRVSVDDTGHQRLEGSSFSPAISGDGRYVVFTSNAPLDSGSATDLAARRGRAGHGINQVFVRDLNLRTTRRVSRRPDGREPNGPSFHPSISGDGRWVGFVSNATNLAAGDSNDLPDVYLHDLESSQTMLVSRAAGGGAGNGASTRPVLSETGRFIAFQSEASNLLCGNKCRQRDADINLVSDAFLFDRDRQRIVRLSTDAEAEWMETSGLPASNPSERLVVFSSRRPIDDQDTGNDFDLFVWTPCVVRSNEQPNR